MRARYPAAMNRNALLATLGVLLVVCCAAPAEPPGAPSSPHAPPALALPPAEPAAPATQPISRDMLLQMYAQELGNLWKPELGDRLYKAHQLVETWFAADGDGRKKILADLKGIDVDPNLVARITRLRMNWQPLAGGGIYYINERIGAFPVIYFLGLPKEYDRTRPWPLVIKLPTAHAFVTDPPPDGAQVSQIYTSWMKDELAKHPDAVVVMPLLNLVELWGPSYGGMNNIIQPMQDAADRVNIDPARIYVTGHSMAAHATWNIGLMYGTYFASIQPLAGAARLDWQRLRLMNLRNTTPVIWHDADDQSIPVDDARSLVRILKTRFKIDVVYNETKGVGHVPTEVISQSMYEQMRAVKRDLYPKVVSLQSNRPDTVFNRLDWVQVYQFMNPGEKKRLSFQHGSGNMQMYQNTCTVNATLAAPNRIELQSDNVEFLRIYLNDQMIDFYRPVTVIVNRRPRFEGMVSPNLEEMLKDQAFLGRGWRYFTGIIDIDLEASAPGTGPASGPATRRSGVIEIGPRDGETEPHRIVIPPR